MEIYERARPRNPCNDHGRCVCILRGARARFKCRKHSTVNYGGKGVSRGKALDAGKGKRAILSSLLHSLDAHTSGLRSAESFSHIRCFVKVSLG
jgi:hypothetical protein